MSVSYGVVQGRLLPPVDDHHIQAFPTDRWREEFMIASHVGCEHIEWIVTESTDEEFTLNPITHLEPADLDYIRSLNVTIDTLCFDGLMAHDMLTIGCETHEFRKLTESIITLVRNCSLLGVEKIVLPFLGKASIAFPTARNNACNILETVAMRFVEKPLHPLGCNVFFSIETDMRHDDVFSFAEDHECGVTFDTGNLLRLGYNLREHFDAYGSLIDNVHVKDMTCEFGHTTRLGTGLLAKHCKVLVDLRDMMLKSDHPCRFTFQTARDRMITECELFRRNIVTMERIFANDGQPITIVNVKC